VKLAMSVRPYASDVLLGSAQSAAPATAPLPPNVIPLPTVPSIAAPLVPTIAPRVLVRNSPTGCAKPAPFAFPAHPAPNSITNPPVAAVYDFRTKGEMQVGGANSQRTTLPSVGQRQVKNVHRNSDGSFTFDVLSALGGDLTQSTYLVVPTASTTTSAGLYVSEMQSRTASSTQTTVFQPVQPLLLLRFPVVVGDTWAVTGVDPVHQTTMSYTATVGKNVRVDGCGVRMDAASVALTGNVTQCVSTAQTGERCTPDAGLGQGAQADPQQQVQFTARYAIGTQYGGIALADDVSQDGYQSASPYSLTEHSVIDTEPALAQSGAR
jgi:hypothetical protein